MKALDWKRGHVEMSHGAGGRAMAQLVEAFVEAFDNPLLALQEDCATFAAPQGRMAMTTDAFVVSPLFFPGGDIGKLAICGTVNDIAMGGARPLYLSASFILEEGFALSQLRAIVDSMAHTAKEAGVRIVAGDTKVVERHKADGLFIITTGIGQVETPLVLGASQVKPGDAVLLSGSIGEHGIALLSARELLGFEAHVHSDCACLHGLTQRMLDSGAQLRFMRDATRGGVAAILNEVARAAGVGVFVQESAIAVSQPVAAACALLGMEALEVANEGKLVAICPPEDAPRLLKAMQHHPLGEKASLIGHIEEGPRGQVRMQLAFGSCRVVPWPLGEQLPRIC
ncbi:MAG: hydrogenase expression/formation protein HypE [Proteobacteria bacterium]|nr:hydrogenase expression/formation protein HypE [Cystobacterineae bacterium]MCL2313834.1 hydrogenase expression/formation protein HypE [Pseudomonadota bacterium]